MAEPTGQEFGSDSTRRWQKIVLAVLRTLGRRLQTMPHERAMRWGERFGRFAHFVTKHFVHRSQRYAHRNLILTQFPHPGVTTKERDVFIRRVFIQFAKTMTDFLR